MAFTVPLTPAQFRNNIIVAGSFSGGTGPLGYGGGPGLRDQTGQPPPQNGATADVHFELSGGTTVTYQYGGVHLQSQGQVVSFRPGNAGAPGQAVYLPFLANNIASAMVPGAGVECFFTDALSGCAIFIDRVVGTNDLVVSHGNAMSHCPNRNQVLANPDITRADSVHFAGAMNHMANTLHQSVVNDRSAALGAALTPLAHLQRTRYMQCVDDEVARKEGQGRSNVDIAGTGTNVMGFRIGGHWQFWYQTWAIITYTRPKWAPKGWFYGRDKGIGSGKILACERFL